MIDDDEAVEAIEALRRTGGPRPIPAEADRRIEAAMLTRFDRTAGERRADTSTLPLEVGPTARSSDGSPTRLRPAAWIAIAAAALVGVLGAVALLRATPDTDVDIDVGATIPSPTAVAATLEQQFATYCTEFITPIVDANERWSPSGFRSEARADVLIAVEQAAQGLADLGQPAAALVADRDTALLALATEARRATTLGPGGDDALIDARDRLIETVASLAPTVPECAAGSGR